MIEVYKTKKEYKSALSWYKAMGYKIGGGCINGIWQLNIKKEVFLNE